MDITPEEARRELARRELAKRGIDISTSNPQANTPMTREEFMQAIGMNRTPLDTLRDLAAGAITGLGKGGQGIAKVLTGGYAPSVDWDAIGKQIGSPNPSSFVQGIGSFLPYSVAAGAKFLPQLGAGAFYGASQNPDHPILGGLSGAGTNALGYGLGKALPFAYNLIKSPINTLAKTIANSVGSVPKDYILNNFNAAQGTDTSLGNIIGSPTLKRLHENILTKIPFSGANETLQNAANQTMQHGENILTNLLGENNPGTIVEDLNKQLNKNFIAHQNKKNKLYNNFNDLADELGFKPQLNKFTRAARKNYNAINDTTLLKYEPDVAKIFNKLGLYKNPTETITNQSKILNEFGNPYIDETFEKSPTAKEVNLLKGKLNQYAEEAASDPGTRNLAKIYGKLARSLKSDLNNSLKSFGNSELSSSYKNAEENYANNFSNFLDNEVYKYLNRKADHDTLVENFIKISKNSDRVNHLSKLIKTLPESSRNALAYSYFSRALENTGNLNPNKLNTLIRNIGPKQLKALVPNQDIRNALHHFKNLSSMNSKGLNAMYNPLTGQQALDAIPLAVAASGHGGVLGGLAKLAGLSAIGRPVVKGLTSEGFRNNVVNHILNPTSSNQNIPKYVNMLLQPAIMNSQGM